MHTVRFDVERNQKEKEEKKAKINTHDFPYPLPGKVRGVYIRAVGGID